MPAAVERRLEELAALVRRMGYVDIEARLQVEREILDRSLSRIAVVGGAGIGKAAAVNREVLAEDLLPTESPAAVPIEIRQGSERRMAIFPVVRSASPTGGKTELFVSLPACEGSPVIIDDPTPADVRRHTTADTPAALDRLSKTTARVRIILTSPLPAGLTLVNMPGTGAMDRAAATIRYRILPACDRILLMPRGGVLSADERAFLESPVLAARHVRLVPPDTGRTNPKEHSRQRRTCQTAVLAAAGDVRAEQAEQTACLLAEQAALATARCAAELIGRSKPRDECRRIQGDVASAAAAVGLRQAKIAVAFRNDLAALETQVSEAFVRDMRAATGYGGAAACLGRHLETTAARCAKEMVTAVRSLAGRYVSERLKLLGPWETVVRRELGADAVPTLPSSAARVTDTTAVSGLNPFSVLADIVPAAAARPRGSADAVDRPADISGEIPCHIERMFRPVAETLPAAWDDDVNSRLEAVRRGISAACISAAPERRLRRAADLAALTAFMRDISICLKTRRGVNHDPHP